MASDESVHDAPSRERGSLPASGFAAPPVMTEEASATIPWTHTTRTFDVLGNRFAVRSTHAGIGRYIDEMYAPSVVSARPQTTYSILDGLPGTRPHALYVGEERVALADRAAYVLNRLTWQVNRQVIDGSRDYVLVHAAAAVSREVGVLLPAAMEAGKTTLVAGLVKAGFAYLTDEAAAIDPDSLLVHAYPKPLSIDEGSWSVHADLRPAVDESTAAYLKEQWHVPPQAIRADAVVDRATPRLVVFPTYQRDAATVLHPVRRSEALVAMLKQTFGFHRQARRNVQALGQVVGRCACYRLVSGDLEEACSTIEQLVQRLASSDPDPGDAR